MTTTVIVPGLGGSGPDHWQTWVERQFPDARRVEQADWSTPDLPKWSAQIERVLLSTPSPLVVAHSFGCLAAIDALRTVGALACGALLVAPADPSRFGLDGIETVLSCPTAIVASTNDPWMDHDRARLFARACNARFVSLGAAGHINVESGFGPWPAAIALMASLERESRHLQAFRRPQQLFG